jgi:amidase
MNDDLPYRSARAAAAAIRAGKIRAREHLEALLERQKKLDGPLNCVVTIDAERARAEADAADAGVRRGDELGPLHGVAMTVKDSFQTRGMRTTSGAPELAGFVPAIDAAPIARLRASGAVIYGKTNLPIYAGDAQSYNEVFGTTNNPWNVERTVGGSSGGSAGALAAGLTPLELGSDIGGSIRGPASDCGVTGHKPSFGIVSARGHIPGPPGSLTQADIAVVGPLARDVDDLELALDVLVGPDEWHAPAVRLELPPPRHRELDDYRVAAWLDDPACPVEREVREGLEAAARALEREGARVDGDARPGLDFAPSVDTYRRLLSAAMSGGVPRDVVEAFAQAQGDDEVARARRETAVRHRDWLGLNERRLQMRQRWHEFFREWDAVLLPVLPTVAIPHDHSEPIAARTFECDGETRPYLDRVAWAGLTGVAYLPATVVPVGTTSAGLPFGVQIAGPFLEDRTTLALARHLERVCGGFQRPPGF